MTQDQYHWWRNALVGIRGELTPGNPHSGFYRNKERACAIWRDESGTLFASVSSGYAPKTPSEIDEAFGFWSMSPIAYDEYKLFIEEGRWLSSIDPAVPGLGDNLKGLSPSERVRAEITDLMERYQTWFATLPNGIENDLQNDKAGNYAKEIATLGKRAEETREREKAPHLEAGRKVDETWKPTIALADDAKRKILAPTTEYRRKRAEEERIAREAETKRLREEAARQHAEALARAAEGPNTSAPPPYVPPVSLPPKRPTGLRTVKVVAIDDLPALAAQIAAMQNAPEDFVEACRKAARKMLDAGIEIKGAHLIKEQRAA